METFEHNGVAIADTFAEAFTMVGTRVIVTAATPAWAEIAGTQATGFATSVIACNAEAAIECTVPPESSPDGRPGVSLLIFAFNRDALTTAVIDRVGQCVLTCPTTACYNGLPDGEPDKQFNVGGQLRFFGDGYQGSKKLGDRRLWRVPVMDGEFLCEEHFGSTKGVAGGNLLICGTTTENTLAAATAAADSMRQVPDCVLPFPGGLVRSGSKVGSQYKALKASTNDAWCPTLRAQADSVLPDTVEAVYEIVIDGLTIDSVTQAMRAGLDTASNCDGVELIGAGNYGGQLGQHHIQLRDCL
ncbi:MAG TPA: formylmethanofuran--tetrahydromethanopterin N-formyltransferase [Planctomycetaceae bacterium]|nr:formylmethanofuran--tetrahydromethanopterin N-formyltransferase [Planctomycetaceae bacterium]HCK52212.1 formylmethanofuran--tetrahydromethanopterin N-formyltransferase [Planctomycetaceae bacterium]